MQEKCLLSGFCETQIGIYIECCSLLKTIGRREIGLKFLGSFSAFFIKRLELWYFTVFRKMREFDGLTENLRYRHG